MEADPGDRLSSQSRSGDYSVVTILLVVAIIAAVTFWYLSGNDTVEAPTVAVEAPAVVVPPPPVAPPLPPAPDIPPAPTAPLKPVTEAPPVSEPPVSLADSDSALREQLDASSSPLLAELLENDQLIERSAALIDSSSRGLLMRKLLPVEPPAEKFPVSESAGKIVMDPAGYSRYDSYASAIEALDTAALVKAFHQFRPLLEQTYAGLGYEGADLDNALIRTLDRILATPVLDEPAQLQRSKALYRYVDPALEQRTSLQKQLLRTGPENTARIQRQARALRQALLKSP